MPAANGTGPEPAPSAFETPSEVGLPGISLDSAILLRGHKVVQITHNESVYKLQATRQGKLILTK